MRLINEIKVTVEDYKANSVGGLTLGLKIWNQAVCPFLYGNSSCWIQIPKKALTLLNSIQRDFFRSLFLQPKGCPIPLFLYDTGSLSPENHIILQKLLLLFHLCHLPDSSLAKQIYLLQKEQSLHEGLITECENHLREMNIYSGPECFTKRGWAKLIKERIHSKNKDQLLNEMKNYKKIDYEKMKEEGYKEKPYLYNMTVSQARTFFAYRCSMISTIKMNFKNKKEFRDTDGGFLCECGEHLDSQSALLSCKLYTHLREGLQIHSSDKDLVKYVQLVIKERHEKENKTSSNKDSMD